MKKRNPTILKSPVLNGSTSNRCWTKATHCEPLLATSIEATPTSGTRLLRIKPRASTTQSRQTTRPTSGGSMPSTRGCGLYRTQSSRTSWKTTCMPITHRERLKEDLQSMRSICPMHQRIRSTATSKARMGAALKPIGIEYAENAGEPSQPPNPGKIGSSLISDQGKSTSAERLGMRKLTSLFLVSREGVSSWSLLTVSSELSSWNKSLDLVWLQSPEHASA